MCDSSAAGSTNDVNPLCEVPPSPLPCEEHSSNPSYSYHCIVEDVHGHPASQPLSLSNTPERSSIPQFAPQSLTAGSFVSPVYDKDLRLSDQFPSLDHDDFPPSMPSHPTGAGDPPAGAPSHNATHSSFVALTNQRSGGAVHSRNGGRTTVASSMSGLHVTQSGIVIPPIQGIPQPKGLPPASPVQYAKLKEKPKTAQKRSRLAVKGAFSNMTSVAVLQQVQPFQKKTRQVEPASWSRLDALTSGETPLNDEERERGEAAGDAACVATTADPFLPTTNAAGVAGAISSSALQSTALPDTADRAALCDQPQMTFTASPPPQSSQPQQPPQQLVFTNAMLNSAVALHASASHHTRTSSGASQNSLTPSEAAMVAAAWEEDVAAAAAAAAAATTNSGSQLQQEVQDDWDRAEEEAMRIRDQMLQQQQQQQQQQQRHPSPEMFEVVEEYVPPPRQSRSQPSSSEPACATPLDTQTNECTPPAMMNAAVVQRYASPTQVSHDDPTDEVAPYAVRTAASADRSPTQQQQQQRGAAQEQIDTTAAPRDLYSAPRREYPEKRNSQGAGTPFSSSSAGAHKAGKRTPSLSSPSPGKASVYPRGFEQYAEKGQQRRAEAERAQQQRAAEAAGETFSPPPPPPRPLSSQLGAPTSDADPNTSAAVCANADDETDVDADAEGLKRPRKMSVLPLPRGFEAFAQKGQARRAEVEKAEQARLREEAENCTHAPRTNVCHSTFIPAPNGRGGTWSAVHTSPSGVTVELVEGELSVFQRLWKDPARREDRRRMAEEVMRPSFTPQITAAKAAEGGEEGKTLKPRAPSRDVFEALYAMSKKSHPKQHGSHDAAQGEEKAAEGTSKARRKKSAHATPPPESSDAPDDEHAENGVSGDNGNATAVAPQEEGEAQAKKPQSEIVHHLQQMELREEERRTKWQQHLDAQLAAYKERANHPSLNPKTGELAERARARYRMREEQKKLQEAAEKERQAREEKEAENKLARLQQHRPARNGARLPPSQQPPLSESVTPAAEAAPHKTPSNTISTTATVNTPARRLLGAEFYAHQQRTEERKYRHLEQLRLQQAEAELRECTFRPRLNTASERMAQRLHVESYERAADDEQPPSDDDDTFGILKDDEKMPYDYSRPASVPGTNAQRGDLVPSENASVGDGGRSPFVSARNCSLMRELREETPLRGSFHYHQDAYQGECASEDDSDDEPFTLNVHAPNAEDVLATTAAVGGPHGTEGSTADSAAAVAGTQRSAEPLSKQLRNLEEMLREWKELERECSPMLRQRQEAGLVD